MLRTSCDFPVIPILVYGVDFFVVEGEVNLVISPGSIEDCNALRIVDNEQRSINLFYLIAVDTIQFTILSSDVVVVPFITRQIFSVDDSSDDGKFGMRALHLNIELPTHLYRS